MPAALVSSFISLTQARVTLEEDSASVNELLPSNWPMGKSVGIFLKVIGGGDLSSWWVWPTCQVSWVYERQAE